jgi:hypothetical protein
MAVCRATKANGDPCRAPATGPHGYCWAHDPANAEQRHRMASRAARARPNRELREIKSLLEDLTNRVLQTEGYTPINRGAAAIANQLINTRLRAIELERKIKETDELEERIGALEAGSSGGGRRWGA